MGSIRKAILSILAGAALVAAAAAAARNLPPSEPKVAPSAATAPNLPPTYFGPAYSAAAVYDHIRPRDVAVNTRFGAARRHGRFKKAAE